MVAIMFFVAVIAMCVVIGQLRKRKRKVLFQKISKTGQVLCKIVPKRFLVQPCPRCHEPTMRVLEFSPNARSIHYQCAHCSKKMYAAAASPDASETLTLWTSLVDLTSQYGQMSNDLADVSLIFETVLAPLPYEQTSRTPIPEAIRSEVWRRDGGRCVECGSQNITVRSHDSRITRWCYLGAELAALVSEVQFDQGCASLAPCFPAEDNTAPAVENSIRKNRYEGEAQGSFI